MENKSNKNFERITIMLLLMVICILEYYIYTSNKEKNIDNEIQKDIIQNSVISEAVKNDESETIIGINDCLLGSFKNNVWYNTEYAWETIEFRDKDFYIQDIEKYEKYYVHEYGKKPIEITDYIDKTEDFYYVDNTEGFDFILDKNGRITDNHFRFKTPQNITENIKVITNNSEEIFVIDMTEIEPTQTHKDIVAQVKQAKYVSEIDTEISKVIETDYNNDGNKEVILVVNPVRDDLGYVTDKDGACCFVIMIQDKEYKIIYQEIVYENEIDGVENQIIIEDIDLCDLNYNGKADICVAGGVWDIPVYTVYEYDDETENFEMELCGYFGW